MAEPRSESEFIGELVGARGRVSQRKMRVRLTLRGLTADEAKRLHLYTDRGGVVKQVAEDNYSWTTGAEELLLEMLVPLFPFIPDANKPLYHHVIGFLKASSPTEMAVEFHAIARLRADWALPVPGVEAPDESAVA